MLNRPYIDAEKTIHQHKLPFQTMLKKIFLTVIALLIFLIVWVLVKTFSTASIQPQPRSNLPKLHEPLPGFAERLSRALQFETISHKPEMMDSAAFGGLLAHLEESFPLVFSMAEAERISEFSLLLKIEGSEPAKNPLLLLAHLDVVPVEYATESEWHHPPFSGKITEEHIYGRGTLDDKSGVLGILEAVEVLLKNGFEPSRSLYLFFGQDEEIGGNRGAAVVAQKFREKGQTFEAVLDEGGVPIEGSVPGIDGLAALVGVAEKGYVSFSLECIVEGGHSSMPEKKTALSRLVTAIERIQKNPFGMRYSEPMHGFMDYLGPEMPFVERMAFANRGLFKPVIMKIYDQSGASRALVQTTITPTIFRAGIKDNVIPNRASAVVNLRLLPGDSIAQVQRKLEKIVDDTTITFSIYDDFAMEASAVTDPYSPGFKKLARTVNEVFPGAVTSPYLTLGATDARYFTDLSPHVFRFLPYRLTTQDLPRIHGLNERIGIAHYREGILFYQNFIRAFDE